MAAMKAGLVAKSHCATDGVSPGIWLNAIIPTGNDLANEKAHAVKAWASSDQYGSGSTISV